MPSQPAIAGLAAGAADAPAGDAAAARGARAARAAGGWLVGPRWDGLLIFGSVVLVALPLTTYWAVATATGVPPRSFQHDQALSIAMFINLAAAFGIGGPHMYATFTATLAERRFRERHPWLLRAALAVPVVVLALAVLRIELLLALFFGWASVHVVHQVVYLVQQYQDRAPGLPRWSRAIDHVLAATCLYPVASWRLLAEPGAELALPLVGTVGAGFHIGLVDVATQMPGFLRGQTWIAGAIGAVFAVAALAFLARTGWELATGRLVWPRTLLLLLTAPVAFALPLFDNMDVALQGFNLWHSTQYLGLVWLMNRRRYDERSISSPFVSWLAAPGRAWSYYAFLVAVSLAAGGLMGVLHYGVGLPMLQVYYCVLLSGLWIHYLWDHAVFLDRDALAPAAPVGRPAARAALAT